MQYNVHEAKTQFSRLLELVSQGEPVVIAKNGLPVAQLVPFRRKGIVLGAGRRDPDIDQKAIGGDWWQAMTDQEADDFVEGR